MPTAARFLLPSAIGVLLFLVPFEVDGTKNVLLGIIANWINANAGEFMRVFCAFVFIVAGLLTPLFTWGPEALRRRLSGTTEIFATGPFSAAMRMAGAVFCGLTFWSVGPEWIIGADTGGMSYFTIAAVIFCIIGVGAMFMPLLTDYGLLEMIGTLLRRPFRKIFNLPGRSTIDALASWVGASSIAVLVTARQYRGGYYTAREASVIATNFSVVSVPFVFLTAQVAGIPQLGGTLYIAMVFIGVCCALITPRLPPLNKMQDDYYAPVGRQVHEEVESGMTTWQWARHEALARARTGPGPAELLRSGATTVVDLFFTMMPVAMTIEFIALALYHHTGILHVITMPLVPLLQLLALPDAAAAAPGLIVGFLDQFVPALIAASITSPVTSFVLAGLSVTQLIFMAETGILIYRSSIPLPIRYLAAVFALRTVIALPILVAVAHWAANG